MGKSCPICGKEIYLGEREIAGEFIAYEACSDEKCGYEWEIYRTTEKAFFEAFMWTQEWALDKGDYQTPIK